MREILKLAYRCYAFHNYLVAFKVYDGVNLSRVGIVIVSAFFGLLHAGNISPWNLDCVLAFSVGFLFSIVRERGGSIYGIAIAHGLINIVLFLIAPLYL